jgi:RimJ/RimL family protein N-acetyltransferase
MVDPAPIPSERLSLVPLPPALLAAMRGDVAADRPFEWPRWWPDEADRGHLALWQDRAAQRAANVVWGPRAVVDRNARMLGHAGFHLPPRSLEAALDDPSFVGARDPASGGVVEVGYTIFPDFRHHGYATEAVTALVDWAQTTNEVGAVLAAVDQRNDASVRVLERVGRFVRIGTCRAGDGTVEDVFRRDL